MVTMLASLFRRWRPLPPRRDVAVEPFVMEADGCHNTFHARTQLPRAYRPYVSLHLALEDYEILVSHDADDLRRLATWLRQAADAIDAANGRLIEEK